MEGKETEVGRIGSDLFVPFFFFFNSDYEHCMGRGMEIRWLIKSDARDGIC